ncbi:hypothetical protein [Streptomyces sp. NRRL WC-3742]|uniref:hypothetical protein n=1 Tax=Streptomyces sp. NRRL WC-3742 TaxID=1463934 RepID=UPI000691DF70|nr:hypothetical protein [Streptomyces sp. NRRL WC-3742]
MNSTVAAHPWDLPPEHTLIAVDIKDFSKAPEHRQPFLRRALDDALESAFTRSDLLAEWKSPTYRQNTGDGCILVLPPARTWRLVDPLIRLLDEELHGYEQQRQREDPPLLVRVSVHVGPMPESNLADAINDVARFVDSDAVRAGIAAASAHGSYTALVLSDEMYRRVVLARRSRLLPERDFLPAPATVAGKGFTRTAWVHVPRLSPSVVAQYLEEPQVPSLQEEGEERRTTPPPPSGIQVSGNVNINTLADKIDTLRTRQINRTDRAFEEGRITE